jgi:hypothetical protein
MVSKDFERTIRFYEARDQNGNPVWLPIVEVTLLVPGGGRIDLALFFDTGASVTTLRADLYHILGLQSWDQGQLVSTATGGGIVDAYKYMASLDIFGKLIQCPVHLLQTFPYHPLYCGLLGRDTIFKEFGFGFWESTNELWAYPLDSSDHNI